MNEKAVREKPKAEKEAPEAPRGMHDVLPEDWLARERVGTLTRKFAEFYNFTRVETPLLEDADLIARAVGPDTDVAEKELYLVRPKSGDALALRPENVTGIVRAFAEHKLARGAAFQKFWHSGPVFRQERTVQPGRLRAFTQFGLEIIGTNDPLYDAELILIFWKVLEELKLKGLVLKINSTGCRICRPAYMRQLQSYYKNHADRLCDDCTRREKTSPLRLLDCDRDDCMALKADAPSFFDKLCSPCSTQMTGVLEYLDETGIPYSLDNLLVRGLDYYVRTVFEIGIAGMPGEELGALAGGGRYDYLFEGLGFKATPASGGALGIERVVAAMRLQDIAVVPKPERRIFVMHVGELAKKKLLQLMEELRTAGILVDEALSKDSLNAQLKFATKDGSSIALIVGQKEIFEGSVIIRDMKHATQETVPRGRMVEEIKKRLK